MIRLYILLCLLPCLLLTAPFAHAALLPRLKTSFKLPGAIFTEPETRSLKVVPFKELPGKSHHGHRLHHTLSLVKRLVEDQGDMVEVTEEALEELLEQINRLHDQVNGMMPSGAPDSQSSRETGASSNGQPGQLPAGSSDGSSSDGQPEQLPEQSPKAEVPDAADVPGPSEVPVVSEPSLRPELPEPTDEGGTVREPPPGAPDQPSVPGQSQTKGLDRQAGSALAPTAVNPTQAANDKLTNPPSEAEPEESPGDGEAVALTESVDASGNGGTLQSDNLPNNAVAQPTGNAQNPTGIQTNTAQDVRPTEEPQDEDSSSDSSDADTEEPSALPGGAFVESPDGILQTLSSDVASAEQTGDLAYEENQESSPPDDECVEDEEVSGLPGTIRNPNCTPGNRPSANDPTQDASANPTLVATAETSLAQVAVAASELATLEPTKGDSPVATKAKGPAPALETEATSTPTINAVDLEQLAAPTLIASPPTASNPEPSTAAQLSVEQTSPSLRTLVFTSVITRSSTIKITTTRTEFVDANEPTRSFKAPGHVFKEDEDAGAAFNKDGKLAAEDSDDEDTPEAPLQGTSLNTEIAPEITSLSTTTMAMTTTISLSYRSTMPTPEATQNLMPALVPSAIIRGNGTYDTTPTSGFKTIRSTASMAERALI
ncbi:hypothetical protein FVEN_g9791 [Fusarium venenatum]|uniref:uncharacterized protein n=1 Tax=Fusarium venenatum TaxID=56646 RepID=UPI001D8B4564|nr:hypothetical protein FVEN_g9791 [Fusarium venenatum]KAH7003454.1 hypothetical protein EDB82DRAFT_17676 [Fusarium venenatum]